jgi:hypothetical protein
MANKRFSGGSIADAIKNAENTHAALAAANLEQPLQDGVSTEQASQNDTFAPQLPDGRSEQKDKESDVSAEQKSTENTSTLQVPDKRFKQEGKEDVSVHSVQPGVQDGAGFEKASIEQIFSKEVKYKNSRAPVVICEKYREFISLLSELSKCEISQIINNVLSLYFEDEKITKQLSTFAQNKYKERLQQFKS